MLKSEIKYSLRLSLPLVASNLVQASSGFIATWMVAYLGRDALAGAALGSPLYWTLIALFLGVLSSVSVLVAQNFGAENHKGIELAASQGFILAVAVSIPSILIVWFAPIALAHIEDSPIVLHNATLVLHALAWCILPMAFLYVMQQFLIGLSHTRLVLWISLIQVPFEILFSYAFVFGKFYCPKCGISGVGYGFTIVFVAATIIIGLFLHKSKFCSMYKIFANMYTFDTTYFLELVRVGWPVGCMWGIEVAFLAGSAFLMGKISNDQLAAHQIARQYLSLGMMFIFALSETTTIMVGQAVGRQNKDAVKTALYANLVVCSVATAIIAIAFIGFAKPMVMLDLNAHESHYQQLLHYGSLFLIFSAFVQIIDNARFTIMGALRGLKDTRTPMYITFFVFWVLAFPLSYFFAFTCKLGGAGLWLGLLVGILVCCLIFWHRFNHIIERVDLSKILL